MLFKIDCKNGIIVDQWEENTIGFQQEIDKTSQLLEISYTTLRVMLEYGHETYPTNGFIYRIKKND